MTSLAIILEGWESGAVASPKLMSGIFRFGDTIQIWRHFQIWRQFRFGDNSDLATLFRFGDTFQIWRQFRFGDIQIWRHFSDLATLSQELAKVTNPALGHLIGIETPP